MTKFDSMRRYYYSGDYYMKVKLFDEESEVDLEESINDFINEDIRVNDIKYNVAIAVSGEEQLYCFSAMVIYEEK